MKRRIKTITAVLCVVSLALIGTIVFADNDEPVEITEFTEQEVSVYSEGMIATGTCGDNLVWEIDNNGMLTISGSGELYDYELTENVPWNEYAYEISGVTLNIDTSSLCSGSDNCAFGMLEGIPEIKIPEGVVSIPESKYLFPYDLKKLILPSTYTGDLSNNSLIKDMCYTMIEVSEDNPVYSSIDGVLFNKDKTKLIQYTQSATKPNYVIPDTVADIDSAFSGARYLETLTISKNVEIINIDTYNGDFSNSGIGVDMVYSKCKAVYVDEENPYFFSVDGVLYNKDMTILIWCPPYKTGSKFDIPIGVETIAPGAFGNSKYQNITIPDGVTVLGAYAFFKAKMNSAIIPSTVQNVYIGCFMNAPNLSKVYIEACDAKFSTRVFEGDRNLKTAGAAGNGCNIEFEWTDKIPDNVFYKCTALTSVAIPDTITSIGSAAFLGCSTLKAIEVPNSVNQIGSDAFSECRSMANIQIDNLEGYISGEKWSAPKAKVTYQREISVEPLPDYDYNGEEKMPVLTLTERKTDGTIIRQLTEGTDYTVVYSDNICAGTATATIEYINSYSKLSTKEAHFTIIPKSCEGLTIMPITDQAYTGREIKPELTIINN